MKIMQIVLVIGLLGWGLLQCAPSDGKFWDGSKHAFNPPPMSACPFHPSDFVRSKVSGDVGQVLYTHTGNVSSTVRCNVDVRFAATQATTSSRVLSSDGPVKVLPLAIVYNMRTYELELVE